MKLLEMRLRANLTQAEVAASLGLKSNSAVSMYESGARKVSAEMVPKLAKLYGCTIAELYGEDTGGGPEKTA